MTTASRRQALAAALAAWLPGAAGAQGAAPAGDAASSAGAAAGDTSALPTPDPSRLALVIGNRDYPGNYALPSIHKNAHDMVRALKSRGFTIDKPVLDASPDAARREVDAFIARAQAAPADATLFFYYSGHGLQIDAENLLVAAGVQPEGISADALVRGSLSLGRDLVQRLPQRPQGLSVAVIDACRTGLGPSASGTTGLNQVEAPPGCLIAFSTGAGRPAIAPMNPEQATFYTRALVDQMLEASEDLSFSELFDLVKLKVERTMKAHPIAAIRKNVQEPFIAANTRVTMPVLPARQIAEARRRASQQAQARVQRDREDEDRDWAALQALLWPPDVLRALEKFNGRWPTGRHKEVAEVLADRLERADQILRRNDVRLYRGSFEPDPRRSQVYNDDLRKAARGDKDAAARVGRQWATAARSGAAPSRYEGWMQYAAELGNGIASYELALHYRRREQPQAAARWESRARELGYTPPPTLDHYRK